jgi:hypothetical protein
MNVAGIQKKNQGHHDRIPRSLCGSSSLFRYRMNSPDDLVKNHARVLCVMDHQQSGSTELSPGLSAAEAIGLCLQGYEQMTLRSCSIGSRGSLPRSDRSC